MRMETVPSRTKSFAADAEKEGAPKSNVDLRLIKEKDEFSFRRGRLTEGHPTLEYVRNLANRIPRKEGFPLNIVIAPDWNEPNAAAFSDGTIFISASLILSAETEEALLGVISHEYVHAYKEHSKKETDKKTRSLTTFLQKLSLLRGHEYEADLRGALFDLEQARINPLGYKAFLEKHLMHEESDFTHGSGTDRVLNIATAIHLVDFKSLTQDLHEIPKESLDALNTRENIISHNNLIRSLSADYWSEEKIAERKKARDKAVEDISNVKDATTAIRILSQRTLFELSIPEEKKVNKNLDIDETIDKIYAKLDDLLPQNLDDESRKKLKLLVLEFFTELHVFDPLPTRQEKEWIPQSFQKINDEARNVFNSPERVLQALELADKEIDKLGIEYSGSVFTIASNLARFATTNNFFGEINNETIDSEAVKEYIAKCVSSLVKISGKFGQNATAEDLSNLMRTRILVLVNGNEIEEARDERKDLTDPKQLEYFDLGGSLGEKGVVKDKTRLNEVLEKFLENSKDLSLNELLLQISFLRRGINQAFGVSRKNVTVEELENLQVLDDQFNDLVITWLIQKSLKELPQFAEMSQEEKDLVFWSVAIRNETFAHIANLNATIGILNKKKRGLEEDEFGEYNEREITLMPKFGIDETEIRIRARMVEVVSTEKLFENANFRSIDNIVLAYRYLADHEYFKANFEIGSYGEKDLDAERIFLDFIISTLHTKNLSESIDFFKTLEARGVRIFELVEKHPDMSGVLVQQITEAMENESVGTIPLEDLLKVSRWISNPFLQNSFQRYCKDLFWGELSFEEKTRLLYDKDGISDFKTREDFIENDIKIKEQYDQVLEKIKLGIEDLTSEGNEKAGVGAVLAHFNFRFRDVNAFTRAILTSQTNETELRKIIYGAVEANFDSDDINSMRNALLTADRILRGLYSLDQFGRQAMLRQIMTSEYGSLPDQRKREQFLNYLFNEWVEKADKYKDLTEVLQKVKEGLVALPEWALLYFALSNALVDKVAIPPDRQHRLSWGDIYEVESDLEGAGASPTAIQRIIADSRLTKLPSYAQKQPRKYREHISAYSEQKLYEALERRGVIKFESQGRLNPLQFTKQTVSRTGAPGVRFLQLAPQFIEVPENYEAEFSEVYDGLKGQSKLAAINLLEREWPEIWDNISEIQERVGGGSIVTVYKVITKENQTEVVKVRNPNIQYHLNETYRFASNVLDYLGNKYGGGYAAARQALEDIKKWIEGDISFEGFMAQDQTFRERHHGYKPEGFNYSIKVPESRGTENPYFSREEFIEGLNLTKWQELEASGVRMREVISLMVKNYVEQVQEGLVHSDVHPGNFRVTPEGQVAILDRNFYLNLTEQEKKLIFSLVNPFVSVQDRVEQLFGYVERGNVDETAAKSALTEVAENMATQNWPNVHTGIVKIKQMGMTVPLNLTLLLKNFNSLEMMAKKAGFRNITDAFLFHP